MFRNFHEDNEGLINRQINLELYASYAYTALAHHFDRWDVALKGKEEKNKLFNLSINICSFFPGHHKFFKKMAEEENEHANKFMEYQNKRGGTVVLLDIKVCRRRFSFKIKIKQKDYFCVVETSSTKLGFCIGSS
jgi:ferritin heavy chain